MLFKRALILLVCCAALGSSFKTYEGYKIYDVTARNSLEKDVLTRIANNEDYDFLALPKVYNASATILVGPEQQLDFENTLSQFRMDFTIVNKDVSQTIKLERLQNQFIRSRSFRLIDFKSFPRFYEINAYLYQLALQYPQNVFVKTVGKSYQGRSIKSITITRGDGIPKNKSILIDAGIHAREWIAPVTAVYIIHQLVENFAENQHLLENYDWIILPCVNPDGYEYTHTNERMWRKTRKPANNGCIGTDGNRNFDFYWGLNGASSNACSTTFMGDKAFSEPETQIVRDIMHSMTGRAKMYLTLHSYGNYLLYPWGWTSNLPVNWKDIDEVSKAGADAIYSATKTKYKVGSSTNVLYPAAGGSDDYALGKAKIPISITMELPKGGSGFDPDSSNIMPMVKESWIGIKAMSEKVNQMY